MNHYWITKMNDATTRRLDKLVDLGIKIDTSTHAGRSQIGYNYLELVTEESNETE